MSHTQQLWLLNTDIGSQDRIRTKLYDKRDDFNFLIVNFNLHVAITYQLFVVIPFPSCSFSWLFTEFLTRETQRVQIVEHEPLTTPVLLGSSSVFSGIRVAQSLVFRVVFYLPLHVILSCYTYMSVLLTASDYIFKLYLQGRHWHENSVG
jgi:hypothetical protein